MLDLEGNYENSRIKQIHMEVPASKDTLRYAAWKRPHGGHGLG